jgi:hypothetical protein
MTFSDQLMAAINDGNFEEVNSLINGSADLNVRCDQGASVIYGAILIGNISIVKLLLENGADPNLVALEPAAWIYADRPLDLARQCRFLLDWDTYNPIVELLSQFGASGTTRSQGITEAEVERRARDWQSSKLA